MSPSANSSTARGEFTEVGSSVQNPLCSQAARMPAFIGGPADAVEKFAKVKAAIIAAGSVGRRIALHLARLQPHTLWIVDPSEYKAESLLTQEITPADVGAGKAENTAQVCKEISPRTNVFFYKGDIQQLRGDAFADATHALLSTDNLKAEVETGQRMLRMRVPLIHAAVHGDSLTAQVRFFGNKNGEGPCPTCGFTEAEWNHLNRETTFRCGGDSIGVTTAQPTMSTGFLCSIAADLALMQMSRHLLGLGKPVTDQLISYCGYTHVTTHAELKRNIECPCEHIAWMQKQIDQPIATCTPYDLAMAAGWRGQGKEPSWSVEVDDYEFTEASSCCGDCHVVNRFTNSLSKDLGTCPGCGRARVAESFFTRRRLPGSLLPRQSSLAELGASQARFAVVMQNGAATLLRERNSAK